VPLNIKKPTNIVTIPAFAPSHPEYVGFDSEESEFDIHVVKKCMRMNFKCV